MRRLVLVHLVCGLGLAVTTTVRAQTPTPARPPRRPPRNRRSRPRTPPAPGSAPAEQPAAAPAADAEAPTRSLFEEAPRQFEISGRLSSVSGDPARFQRYQDLRDGILLHRVRYTREGTDGAWVFTGAADNVGWRDQRFAGSYERVGRFSISGLWDQIPQFYSVDTRTPYTMSGSPLGLDDATQLAIQRAQTNLNAYVPLATQFDLQERRDIGALNFKFSPTKQLDLTAAYTTQNHSGELPWGASFGFSNDVEVALPYESRTNDFNLGAEWSNQRSMLRVAYNGSWFDNQADTLVWDSPLRLEDSTSAPGRGRMALWPSNSANTVSGAGYTKFGRRTQLSGFISLGMWDNNEPLQPFTINPTLRQIALPRDTTEASATVFSTNLNLVSRPRTDWRFSARLRHYGYENDTPHARHPRVHQLRHVGEGVVHRRTGALRAQPHELRRRRDVERPVARRPHGRLLAQLRRLRLPHLREHWRGRPAAHGGRDGNAVAHFRAQYEPADKTGDGLNEDLLTQIGEQPALRHYDIANRSRNRFTGQVDVVPNDLWIFSAVGRESARTSTTTATSACRSRRSRFTLSADYKRRTASAWAPPTPTSTTTVCSSRGRRARDRKWIRSATGRRTRPSA